jgi:hypothetical protein
MLGDTPTLCDFIQWYSCSVNIIWRWYKGIKDIIFMIVILIFWISFFLFQIMYNLLL